MSVVYEFQVSRKRIGEFDSDSIDGPQDAAPYFRKVMQNSDRESFWVMLLNPQSKIIGMEQIAVGTEVQVSVSPKQVFRMAVLKDAAFLVAAHYHTVNDTTPSDNDVLMAKRMDEAGDLIGIPVMGSLVITDEDFSAIDPHQNDEKVDLNGFGRFLADLAEKIEVVPLPPRKEKDDA